MVKSKLNQVFLIGVGVMVAIGFSGIFTWGGLVSTPQQGGNQDQQPVNATLPRDNFQENGLNLSIREQRVLAFNKDVVFVNAFYQNSSAPFSDLETLPEEMNSRVFIGVSKANESAIAGQYQLKPPPQTIVLGGNPTRTQRGVVKYSMQSTGPNKSAVKKAACGSFKDLKNLAATCYS